LERAPQNRGRPWNVTRLGSLEDRMAPVSPWKQCKHKLPGAYWAEVRFRWSLETRQRAGWPLPSHGQRCRWVLLERVDLAQEDGNVTTSAAPANPAISHNSQMKPAWIRQPRVPPYYPGQIRMLLASQSSLEPIWMDTSFHFFCSIERRLEMTYNPSAWLRTQVLQRGPSAQPPPNMIRR
jgi:hypothetical protein